MHLNRTLEQTISGRWLVGIASLAAGNSVHHSRNKFKLEYYQYSLLCVRLQVQGIANRNAASNSQLVIVKLDRFSILSGSVNGW